MQQSRETDAEIQSRIGALRDGLKRAGLFFAPESCGRITR
jgi:hypothetical protein